MRCEDLRPGEAPTASRFGTAARSERLVVALRQRDHGGLSVLVAEGQPPLRAGVRLLLEAAGHRVVEAGSAAEAVAAVEAEQPDVCLLDTGLADGGLGAVERICACCGRAAVVAFAAEDDEASMLAALGAGVSAYLVKGTDDEALLDAIDIAARGFSAVPKRHLHLLCGLGEVHVTGVRLTRRQQQISQYLCEGLHTGEIAHRLGLAPGTVRRHVADLLHKLGATSREQAIALLNGTTRLADEAKGVEDESADPRSRGPMPAGHFPPILGRTAISQSS